MNRVGIIVLVAAVVVAGLFWMGRSMTSRDTADDPFALVDIEELKPTAARAAPRPAEARPAAPQRHVVARGVTSEGSSAPRSAERADSGARPPAPIAQTDDDEVDVSDLSHLLETRELFRAQLEDEDLRGADLAGGNLAEANLRRAQLDNANLKDADLRGADLTGANMVGTDLTGAALAGANLQEAYIQANMRHADLRGADLRAAGLWGVHMNEADLRGANLQGATVKGDFFEADLRAADLRWANLEEANFHRANLDGANLIGATSVSCEMLTIAANWENAYRSPELACGAPIPMLPDHLGE